MTVKLGLFHGQPYRIANDFDDEMELVKSSNNRIKYIADMSAFKIRAADLPGIPTHDRDNHYWLMAANISMDLIEDTRRARENIEAELSRRAIYDFFETIIDALNNER